MQPTRITRRPDWQGRLDAFLNAHAGESFAYGRWDCCLFVCDAIFEMTGTDPAHWFRGRYATRAEAKALVREYTESGASSVKAVVERVTVNYGMPPIALAMAQRGDIVLIRRTAREYSLGVMALNGTDVWVVSPEGLKACPVRNLPRPAEAVQAWRV